MMELLSEIDWEDYRQILMFGEPPVWMQLAILIGLTVSWWVWRVMRGKPKLTRANRLKYKILFLIAFFLILFQEQYDLRGMLDNIGL